MGVETDCPTSLQNIAIWEYWQNADWAEKIGSGATYINILSVGFGWVWFIPLGPTRTSVGLVVPASYFKESGKKPKELYEGLLTDRVVSRNLRGLLRRGGAMFKVDYANAHRDELSPLTKMRSLFVEGALEEPVKDLRCEAFFRYVGNDFRKSKVILDVYHQTRDPSDKVGGYFVSEFKAI